MSRQARNEAEGAAGAASAADAAAAPGVAAAVESPPAPGLAWLARVEIEVAPLVSLGPAPLGERRVVPLLGGTVQGPALAGRVVPGGSDWQVQRSDGATEIHAHYLLELQDGARVEVTSIGLRHGPPEVMAALARGEAVDPARYYFRTQVRLNTGAAAWAHLNRMLVLASGQREAARVRLGLWQVL